MIQRELRLGRWHVEFYFCPDGYDMDYLLDRMWDFGAPLYRLEQALDLMEHGGRNTGFTFNNPLERIALVVVGPTTSGKEFQNTLVHELRHLADAIALSLGVELHTETPAYISGDSVMALADIICKLGCERCN